MTEKKNLVRESKSALDSGVGHGSELTLMLEKREWMPGNESPDGECGGAGSCG